MNSDQDAETALRRVFDQLVPLSLEGGFSIQDIELMVRLAAIKGAVRIQRRSGRRTNISGIAAATGLSRSEVAKLRVSSKQKRWRQKPIDRIVSAWQQDRKYARENSRPLDLQIYGRAPSFHALAAAFAPGIPVRAILDELLSRGDATLLSNQRVKLSNLKRETPGRLLEIGSLIENIFANDQTIPAGSYPPTKRRNLKRR